jgi:hypothetical protein
MWLKNMMISLGNFRINYIIPGLDQTTDTETVLLFWVISQIDTNAAYKQKTQGTKPKWKHSKGSFSDKSMIRKKMLLINPALVYFHFFKVEKRNLTILSLQSQLDTTMHTAAEDFVHWHIKEYLCVKYLFFTNGELVHTVSIIDMTYILSPS